MWDYTAGTKDQGGTHFQRPYDRCEHPEAESDLSGEGEDVPVPEVGGGGEVVRGEAQEEIFQCVLVFYFPARALRSAIENNGAGLDAEC